MSGTDSSGLSRGRYALTVSLVAGAYFATAKLGLQLAAENPSITAVWPPTGISLAAVLIWGYRVWPGVALGAALANTFTGDVPALTVLGITVGNTFEALIGGFLLMRVANFQPALARVRDVLALAVLAAGLSTAVSATIGVTSLWLGDQIGAAGELPSAWRVWWLGDMTGDLLVAPFLLIAASTTALHYSRWRLVEAAAVLCTVVGISVIVFSRDAPLTYLIFPPLMWAALRFRQHGAAVASLVIAAIAVVFTDQSTGPFARGSPDEDFLLSQTFMGVAALAAFLLAAITTERAEAESKLRRAQEKLQGKVEERTAELDRSLQELQLQALITRNMAEGVCLIRASDSAIVYANPEFERMLGYEPGELDGMQAAELNFQKLNEGAMREALEIGRELERSGDATYEIENRKKDGTPIWCRVHASAFDHPEHGKVWVAVQEDITELKRAHVLERSFVPERLPEIPGVKLAARFIPGGAGVEVGGDWYDVLELRDGRLGLVIGDVAGRGVQAAAVMAQLRNSLRTYIFDAHAPATALERLNALTCALDGSAMATIVCLVFDPTSGVAHVSNAGHLPPLVSTPDAGTEYVEYGRALPVGARAATAYSETSCQLDPGSVLLLYTDGLVEKRSTSIEVGLEELSRILRTRHGELDDLCDRLLEELEPSGEDDVAILALETVALPPERLELKLPAEPTALASVRRALRRWLEQGSVSEEEGYEIVLACNEAFANAIEHAYGPADGFAQMEATSSKNEITIIVRDFGQWREPRGENRGRGLELIDAVMDSVDVTKSPNGTIVRMTRRVGK